MKIKKLWQLTLMLILVTLLLSGCTPQKQGDQTQAEPGTIYYVQTTPVNMLKQLKTGEINAFVAWEPNNAQAVIEGTGRFLCNPVKSQENILVAF